MLRVWRTPESTPSVMACSHCLARGPLARRYWVAQHLSHAHPSSPTAAQALLTTAKQFYSVPYYISEARAHGFGLETPGASGDAGAQRHAGRPGRAEPAERCGDGRRPGAERLLRDDGDAFGERDLSGRGREMLMAPKRISRPWCIRTHRYTSPTLKHVVPHTECWCIRPQKPCVPYARVCT